MVRKPGSKHSASSLRVTARRNDWNSIRDLHQGPRSKAASRGRIHDRSPIRLPKHQKSLAERGPSIHDERTAQSYWPLPLPVADAARLAGPDLDPRIERLRVQGIAVSSHELRAGCAAGFLRAHMRN